MEGQNNSREIVISQNDNTTKIEVKKPGSLFYFYNEIVRKLPRDIFDKVNMSYIYNQMTMVNTGTLYIINNDDTVYNIFLNKNQDDIVNLSRLAITQKKKMDNDKDGYIEKSLELLNNNKYKLTDKKISSRQLDSDIKIYINDSLMLDNYILDRASSNSSDYILSKKEALFNVVSLLEDMENINNIEDIIDLESIYNHIGIISKNKFNPVISNDLDNISLSYNEETNKYSIIKNNTREIIGFINHNENGYNYIINSEYENTDLNKYSYQLFKEFVNNSGKEKVLINKKNHS